MSYSVPVVLSVLPKSISCLKDFIVKLKVNDNTMIFLSENCYGWLKRNSCCINRINSKLFVQFNAFKNTKAYIETITIDSSNCSLLKSVISEDFHYAYKTGIPQKIIILVQESELADLDYAISSTVIKTAEAENPVNCIIDTPSVFDNSIVFLTTNSYIKLKKSTNTISNILKFERLIWYPDIKYPGGNIMLHCLNYGNLYAICNMSFPFFTKDFTFNKIPNVIYFIA